jgi:Tfp pilus assembly protein PilF
LGKTELAMNEPEKAIPPLRKAIQLDPNYTEAHFVLGTALRRSGHNEEGIREQKLSLAIRAKERAAETEKAGSH